MKTDLNWWPLENNTSISFCQCLLTPFHHWTTFSTHHSPAQCSPPWLVTAFLPWEPGLDFDPSRAESLEGAEWGGSPGNKLFVMNISPCTNDFGPRHFLAPQANRTSKPRILLPPRSSLLLQTGRIFSFQWELLSETIPQNPQAHILKGKSFSYYFFLNKLLVCKSAPLAGVRPDQVTFSWALVKSPARA